MVNMSYCMFSNTLNDLRDCVDKLDEIGYDLSQLSDDEQRAAKKLFELCKDMAELGNNNC